MANFCVLAYAGTGPSQEGLTVKDSSIYTKQKKELIKLMGQLAKNTEPLRITTGHFITPVNKTSYWHGAEAKLENPAEYYTHTKALRIHAQALTTIGSYPRDIGGPNEARYNDSLSETRNAVATHPVKDELFSVLSPDGTLGVTMTLGKLLNRLPLKTSRDKTGRVQCEMPRETFDTLFPEATSEIAKTPKQENENEMKEKLPNMPEGDY